MTARDLILRAYRFVHITGSGESITNTEASDALEVLNEIIELTAIDKLLAFFKTEIVFPFVPNKYIYTIGPSSTTPDVVVSFRPVEILSGFTRRQNVDLPLYIGNKEDYDRIQVKNIVVAGWGQVVYYSAGYPQGTLYFYQVPGDNLTEVHLTVESQLAPFATLDTLVVLPPGYVQWLRYTLAMHMAPEFGMEFTPGMEKLQQRAEEALKNNNVHPMPVMENDVRAMASRGPGGYNVYSDTTRGTR